MADDTPFISNYLPYLLQRADHLISSRLHQLLKEADVDVSEWRVLVVLNDRPGMTPRELAAIAMLPQPTTSHAVRRLAADGRLASVADDVDRRQRLLSLTDDGVQLVTQLTTRAKELEREAVGGGERNAELLAALKALIADLETRQSARGPVLDN